MSPSEALLTTRSVGIVGGPHNARYFSILLRIGKKTVLADAVTTARGRTLYGAVACASACEAGGAMNAVTPTPEFLRVAQLAKRATGHTPAADTSTHDTSGLWQLRDAHNETICEVSPDGTVVEVQAEAPPSGLLDRIRDLRAYGCSTRAISGWFGRPQSVDQLAEARVVFDIAMDHMTAIS
jgi:hypothetical protein